jgi:ribosomal protein L9
MKIQLTDNIRAVGKSGDIVNVRSPLAKGLIRRGQAKLPTKDSTAYTATEAAKMVRDMDEEEAKEFTKDDDRKTVLKELKDDYKTKEEKETYKTK